MKLCDEGEYSARDGNWGLWSGWSSCSVTCSSGFRTKIRKCNNPAPINGKDCDGASEISERCEEEQCGNPVDGKWSSWGHWSSCSKTCGAGVQFQEKLCDSPKPQWGGKECVGENRNFQSCQIRSCSSKKECSKNFDTWTDCDRDCGLGKRSRKKLCSINEVTTDNQTQVHKKSILEYEHEYCLNRECPGY